MEDPKKPHYIKQLLILWAVLALIGTSWVSGHILRHAIPSLWNIPTPIPPMPGEKIGMFSPYSPQIASAAPITNWEPFDWETISWNPCRTDTYYTSYPAKCRTADGTLIQVGKHSRENDIIPPDSFPK